VEWPQPKAGALRGKKLLVTGIMETIVREDLIQLITDCSGHVMSGMSKNLDILIVGRDAGPSKLEKAESLGLKQMGENEFMEFLIKTLADFTGEDETEAPAAKKPAAKRAAKKKTTDGDDVKEKTPAKKTKAKK
jgi:BRCT domain type II-containing protein